MRSGQAPEKTDNRSKLTLEQWEHIRKCHLSVLLNKKKDLVEIGWVTDCSEKTCELPHTTLAFYSCPKKPCPPISS